MKQPQEIMSQKVLPAIRNNIVKELKKQEMRQDEISKIFDITPSAVSNYVKNKRGYEIEFCSEFQTRIKVSAKKIVENLTRDKQKNHELVFIEINELANYYEKEKLLCSLCKKENNLKSCKIECK